VLSLIAPTIEKLSDWSLSAVFAFEQTLALRRQDDRGIALIFHPIFQFYKE